MQKLLTDNKSEKPRQQQAGKLKTQAANPDDLTTERGKALD